MNIGERVQYYLVKKKLSQKDLENISGIKQQTISNVISGAVSNPSFNVIYAIAKAFKVSLSELAGESVYYISDEDRDILEIFSQIDPESKEVLLTLAGKLSDENSKSRDVREIYVLGNVVAGKPIQAVENILFTLKRNNSQVPPKADFGLKIKGDSMEPLIENGSVVWVKKQNTAENGQIVIATYDNNEAICKRFFLYDDHAVLRSENPEYDDIVITDSSCQIMGIVLNHL